MSQSCNTLSPLIVNNVFLSAGDENIWTILPPKLSLKKILNNCELQFEKKKDYKKTHRHILFTDDTYCTHDDVGNLIFISIL